MLRYLLVIASLAAMATACGTGEQEPPSRAAQPEMPAAPVAADVEQTVTLTDGTSAISGQQVYEQFCAGCHEQGEGTAPQIGEPQDWANRSDLWQAVLFEHANKGYLQMPAKGGEEGLSEADVAAAAEYMLNQSFPERGDDPH